MVLNTLSDIDPIHVRFPLGEREYLEFARRYKAKNLAPGSKAEPVALDLILADGTVHPHRGFTEFIERNVDASTGTLTMEASFPNPDRIVRPGQYGRIRAVVDTLENARLIPQRAVQELQGQHQVWVDCR